MINKNSKVAPVILRGVPIGMLCRSRDVREILGTSFETWKLWREAGLSTIGDIGTDAELVMTDEVIRFVTSNPKIGKRKPDRKIAK